MINKPLKEIYSLKDEDSLIAHDSSFRDPSGFIFLYKGHIYRQVNKSYQAQYEHLIGSGLYTTLVQKHWLIEHTEVKLDLPTSQVYKILKPVPVPFISYPYEWSFSQLKDAALRTLDIQLCALEYGMVLKDASAYNLQFFKGEFVFIDTLSFEIYEEGSPWQAYRQFCQHFLAPLAIMAKKDIDLGQLLKIYIDGIPLNLACKLLPKKALFNPGLLVHLYYHARIQKTYSAGQKKTISKQKATRFSKKGLLGIIQFLRHTIQKLKWEPKNTEWKDYYQNTNYTKKAFSEKSKLVSYYLQLANPKAVWDLGANTGEFSYLAKNIATFIVAFDVDPAAVELNYREVRKKSEHSILPLILDLSNPTPAIGWANQERQSLIERGPADCIMALAIIHHLVITYHIPLERVAALFAQLAHHLIIEFVPKSDSQTQRLLQSKKDIYDNYDQLSFEKIFSHHFEITEKNKIKDTERVLYYMVKIKGI